MLPTTVTGPERGLIGAAAAAAMDLYPLTLYMRQTPCLEAFILSVLASRRAPRSRPLGLLSSRRAGEELIPVLPLTKVAVIRSDAQIEQPPLLVL